MANTKEALKAAVSALYSNDNSDYETALWEIVNALGGSDAVTQLTDYPHSAYEKYCKQD